MIELMAGSLIPEMLDLATRLASEAGDIARSRIGRVAVTRKADNSVVTETDHAIQARIIEAIAGSYPDHNVLAEEALQPCDADPTLRRYTWVVDPLDGTRNYVAGLLCFATSIAVLDQGRPVVGVVAEHNLGQVYAASCQEGATLNGRPIHCSKPVTGEDWLVGAPSSKDALTVQVLRSWMTTEGLVFRNFGTTAYHLGLVASGALSAAFARTTKIWDLAAGSLLVTEAGGCVTDPFGEKRLPFDLTIDPNADIPFLAAAPDAHARLLEMIRSAIV